jgi:hypothetical protein
MIREKIVGAMQSKNLAWHAEFEQAIDRLTAVGMSDALGSALLRAKYCNDRFAGQRALHLLTHKAAQRLKVEMTYARMLATAALKEWMVDACEKCNGTGMMMEGNHSHAVSCKKCNGTGVKKYSDDERALCAGLPVDAWHKHRSRFDGVVTCLAGAVGATTGRVRELLKEAA